MASCQILLGGASCDLKFAIYAIGGMKRSQLQTGCHLDMSLIAAGKRRRESANLQIASWSYAGKGARSISLGPKICKIAD
jgi:hypothetical protein